MDAVWKAFTTPVWLGRHALLLVALGVLGRIGWWQWTTARSDGDWQNYGYAVQWWLFGAFAVFLWVKVVLDELDPQRVEDREQPIPLSQPDRRPRAAAPAAADDDEDPELAEYNRRLAQLAEQARE